jgi:hypothetical protein
MTLLIILAALQVGDILTTLRFLKVGIQEANPILRQLFEEVGPIPVLLLSKGFFIYLCFTMIDTPYWDWAMIALIALYSYVVVHNWRAVK